MNEHRQFDVEDVSEPAMPPKARVEDAVEAPRDTLARKLDYLEGFFAQKPAEASPA